ncbi:MAG TPA: permease prefix domain 1-containing protein [Candidatus Limnocylindrales bacterium]
MTTLTDRYIAATLRSVPEKSRGDLERELRASIGDDVDARVARGDGPDAAEIAALTELGDPARLAAAYAGPQRYLIGPRFFHAYIRTLGIVLVFSIPTVWAVLLAVWLAAGDSVGSALVISTAAALFVGMMAGFWTTVGYAVVEAAETAREVTGEPPEWTTELGMAVTWTPARLPKETSARTVRASDAVEALVGGSIGIAIVFIQRSMSPFTDASGAAIPVMNPALWSVWIPLAIALAVAWMVVELIKLVRGAWSVPIAAAITLLTVASSGVQVYLLGTGQLFNPIFLERLGATGWLAAGSPLVLLLIAFSVFDAAKRIFRAWYSTVGPAAC